MTENTINHSTDSDNPPAVTCFSIEQLVPHDHPMILIDSPVSADESSLTVAVTIRDDSLFYDKDLNAIPGWVGMEMMAQTIAAYAGYQAMCINQPVKVGFLLGTRKYQTAQSWFAVGNQYQITVEKLYQEDNGLGAFKCTMRHDAEDVASANINVFSPPNVDEFLQQEKEKGMPQ